MLRPRFAFACLALLSACNCGDDPGLDRVDTGIPPDARCVTDEDCPARNKCNASIGVCYPIDECTDLLPCPISEQICELREEGNVCVFMRCEDDAECSTLVCTDPDLVPACVSGGCICGVPCNGGCPDNQGCCIPTEMCLDLPPECMGLECPLGQFVSVTSSGAWSMRECLLLGESCRCAVLPPLPIGDIGLYSAMAHDATSPVLTAYNIDYGDLMFGLAATDGRITWEFVDGVPTTTTSITGALDGPRGGNSDPGDDVGLYTDLVIDGLDRPHVVYQDRGRGALKYARQDATGWVSYPIDGLDVGDTGLYSSLTLDGSELPLAAYLSAREDNGGNRVSVLRLAHAQNASPADATDWTTRDLVTTDLSLYSCDERCNLEEVCIEATQRCVVPSPASNCNPPCIGRESCIINSCQRTESLLPFRDFPVARGLWPEVKMLPNGDALIAYYDRVDRNLRLIKIAGPDLDVGAQSNVVVDGTGSLGGTTDDTGLYPSLFVTPGGEVHLTYQNATRLTLMYKLIDGATLQAVLTEEIEIGLAMSGGPDGTLIGADSALVVDAQGTVRVAYQDATHGDLRYARRDGVANWVLLTLAGNEMPYMGSFGFYTDQVLDPTRAEATVSTYRYFLSGPGGPRNGVALFSPP